ncbi:hypothetical protein K450DRAFT_243636 [Umbelopsis ramanniana AG]|uniref:TPX2 C-terminal domain-containing protein n=1 Tax=Umbelopsis ramanniana AG TaxID=1314678 RepID=A0AAD5E8G5_UMBRA|nr:uncharacterized protein K450DRAFT_243636 [Umbelopsis ramanniana AG]KAI8579053.1 hypothetical protein K450DRAFT_243636 [Umbelopsis ramanniana AG]
MHGIDSPVGLTERIDINTENTAPQTNDSFSQQYYSPISPLDKMSASNKRFSYTKRLSSPNLWRIRESQILKPLTTVENSTSPFIATSALAEAENEPIARSLNGKERTSTKEEEQPSQTTKVEPEEKPMTRQVDKPVAKATSRTPPVPSYMRFTEAYKRSKGLLKNGEEREIPHHYREDKMNLKKNERATNARNRLTSTKALLGPKTEGINKRSTIPQPFHFHSSLRSHVIEEANDNEHGSDEPFVSMAVRIRQFEENIAGRGFEHTSKQKEAKHSTEEAHKYVVPRSPKLLTKIRHEQGPHHNHESTNDHPSERQSSQASTAKPPHGQHSSKDSRSNVKLDSRPPRFLTAARATRIPSLNADNSKSSEQSYAQTDSLKSLKRKREGNSDVVNKRLRPVGEALSNKKQATKGFTPTIPKPFSFQTDLRGQHYQDQFLEKLDMWRKRDQAPREYHAKPAPHYPPPIAIKRSVKPLTAAQDLVLHSQIRALERKTAEDEKKLNEKLAAIKQSVRRPQQETNAKSHLPVRETRRA